MTNVPDHLLQNNATSWVLPLVVSTLLLFLTYSVYLVIYRIYFHPIAHIPGPWLARATYWYECYYDVFLKGQYIFKIRDLHAKYGPIIRINPDQVHVNDPDFFDEIYAGASKKRNKWQWEINSFDIFESVFSAIAHDDHRKKRALLNSFFSKQKVRMLQARIKHALDNLMTRIEQFQRSGDILRIDWAFVCLTNDVVTEYAFGRSYDRVLKEDFDAQFQRASSASMFAATVMKHFPWILTLMMHWLPESVVLALNPDMVCYMDLQKDIKRQTRQIMAEHAAGEKPSASQTTIMHEVLDNGTLPDPAKEFEFLWENGQVMTIAGTVTTAAALSVAVVYLQQQPAQLRKLRQELFEAIPDPRAPLDLAALEKLPYLSAVIRECLRIGNGVTERATRIDPDRPTIFVDKLKKVGKEYVIPPQTPMASISMLIHQNPAVYEEPLVYKPERWLTENPPADKYFHPFLKGTRQCIGINLAYAELYLTLATLYRRFGSREVQMRGDEGYLELFETSEKDVEIVGDSFVPMWPKDSKGIRIRVKRES